MLRIIGASEEREAEFARLLAAREGVRPDHPVVRMAVALLGTLARKTSAGYFSEGNTRTYKDMLLENITAAQTLFSLPFDLPVDPPGPDQSASKHSRPKNPQHNPSEGAQ
jgi:hypothetical protein